MAYDPKIKAEAMVYITSGMSLREVVETFAAKGIKVSKTVLSNWANELKTDGAIAKDEIKNETFRAHYELFGISLLKTANAQLRYLADPDVLAKKKTSEVIEHTKCLFGFFRTLEQMHSGNNGASALPERVEGYVVEDDD